MFCSDGFLAIFTHEEKLSKYLNHTSELVSHLCIANSKIFDTQTWVPKHRYDKELVSSKHHLSIIILPPTYVSVE